MACGAFDNSLSMALRDFWVASVSQSLGSFYRVVKGSHVGLKISVSISGTVYETFGRFRECIRHHGVQRGHFAHLWRDVYFLVLLQPVLDSFTSFSNTILKDLAKETQRYVKICNGCPPARRSAFEMEAEMK